MSEEPPSPWMLLLKTNDGTRINSRIFRDTAGLLRVGGAINAPDQQRL